MDQPKATRFVCYCHFLVEGSTPRFMTYGDGQVRVYEEGREDPRFFLGGARPPLIDTPSDFQAFLAGLKGRECFVPIDLVKKVVQTPVQFTAS